MLVTCTLPTTFLVDKECQAELDADMTLLTLGPLHLQGMPESYITNYPKVRHNSEAGVVGSAPEQIK